FFFRARLGHTRMAGSTKKTSHLDIFQFLPTMRSDALPMKMVTHPPGIRRPSTPQNVCSATVDIPSVLRKTGHERCE
ncbi:MAG: hypothetical protein KFF68_16785, partial [Desulfosarcina sp.]|nr:hypothetical protein [Desulfosarcina sp.]